MRDEKRRKEYRDLVYTTIKDLIHIGVWDSDNGQSLNIIVAFGNKSVNIPIKYKDIEENFHSAKGFMMLLKPPLEAILESYLRKAGVEC